MSAPVAAAIRKADPNAFIAWAVEDRLAPLLDEGTLVNHVEALPWQDWKRRRWTPSGFFAPVRTYRRLRELQFDIGIDLQGHSKTAFCLKLAAPQRRIAVQGTDILARRLNPMATPCPSERHVVECNLCALDSLCPGRFGKEISWSMPPLAAERAGVKEQPTRKPLATVCVGAGHPSKVYPIDMWREVAKELMRDFDVAFLGGAGDPDPACDGTRNLVGRLNLRESMAWIAESAVHLAADTGTGHIAAAYGVPVVTAFLGKFSPAQYRPYTEQGRVLAGGFDASRIKPGDLASAARSLVGKTE